MRRAVLGLAMAAGLALPAMAAPSLGSPAPSRGSPAAARAAVERYYAALARRDYRAAYALWSRGGQASGQSYAAFRAGFAQTRRTRVRTSAPVDKEGAAGSSFITVPVDVRAVLTGGRQQHFQGSYVLRRVNDVDGATAEQLTWHIDSARLRVVR